MIHDLRHAATSLLTSPRAGWITLALVLSGLSMFMASQLQRAILHLGGVAVSARRFLAVYLAGNALAVTLPLAGSTAGTAFTYRQLRRHGADAAVSSWVLAISGVISTATLATLLGIGFAVDGGVVRALLSVVAVVVGLTPPVLIVLAPRSERLRQWLAGGIEKVRRRWATVRKRSSQSEHSVADMLLRLGSLRFTARNAVRSVVHASVNWAADALCLVVCVRALGGHVPVSALALVYAAALGAASLSLTPVGIGIVEGAIAVALVDAGVPAKVAVPAAILYRLISCWLPLAVGWTVHARLAGRAARSTHLVLPPVRDVACAQRQLRRQHPDRGKLCHRGNDREDVPHLVVREHSRT